MRLKRFRVFMPIMQTFIEGEGGGDGGGGGESVSERALQYLHDNPIAEGEGAAAAAKPGEAAAGAKPGEAAKPGEVDPAALAAALGDGAKPGEAQPAAAAAKPAEGQPAAAEQPPAFDATQFTKAEPVAKFVEQHLGPEYKNVSNEQLGLVLADAKTLYDIADGKATPDKFLALLKEQFPNSFNAVLQTAKRLAGEKDAAPEDPAQKEIREIRERLDKQERDRQEAVQQEVRQKTHDGFVNQIGTNLAKAFPGFDKAKPEVQAAVKDMYAYFTSGMVSGNKDMLGRFEKGNYVDADRLFTEFHNRMTGIFQAWAQGLIAGKQQQKASNPNIPARGATPAPAGTPQKRDLSSFEGRTAAAMDYLKSEG